MEESDMWGRLQGLEEEVSQVLEQVGTVQNMITILSAHEGQWMAQCKVVGNCNFRGEVLVVSCDVDLDLVRTN